MKSYTKNLIHKKKTIISRSSKVIIFIKGNTTINVDINHKG